MQQPLFNCIPALVLLCCELNRRSQYAMAKFIVQDAHASVTPEQPSERKAQHACAHLLF